MPYVSRNISKVIEKSKKSLLLLGPRQTGKSTLLGSLKPKLIVNLADESEFLAFAANPRLINQRLSHTEKGMVLVDEIQRLPSLLNTIQTIIDAKEPFRFLLTGSSARKLRRGQANLLPGRIHEFRLGPLVSRELEYQCDEGKALAYGSLPGIYLESDLDDCRRTLSSYAATYLKEEIQAEALTRNIEGFARFLMMAAMTATQFLDLQKLATQSQINHQAARRYFELLEDTLIIHRIDAFAKSARTRLVQHPRYVFFDNGVLNGLLNNFRVSDDRKGMLFENLLISQIIHSLHANDDRTTRLSSYRTENGAEVDLIIERADETVALEIKASQNVGKSDMSGLRSFAAFYKKQHRAVIAYQGSSPLNVDGVEVLPWQKFLSDFGL